MRTETFKNALVLETEEEKKERNKERKEKKKREKEVEEPTGEKEGEEKKAKFEVEREEAPYNPCEIDWNGFSHTAGALYHLMGATEEIDSLRGPIRCACNP